MDGTMRDLAGLRGTYKIIDKTILSINLIYKALEELKIKKAIFYIDAPVSNSGRLKQKIEELLTNANFEIEVQVINNVDSVLEKLDNVITSDAIILNKCMGWINLNRKILDSNFQDYSYVDFEKLLT